MRRGHAGTLPRLGDIAFAAVRPRPAASICPWLFSAFDGAHAKERLRKNRVLKEVSREARRQNPAGFHQIGAICNLKSLSRLLFNQQYRQSLVSKSNDHFEYEVRHFW